MYQTTIWRMTHILRSRFFTAMKKLVIKSELILACLMVICDNVLMIKMSVKVHGYDINSDSSQKSDCSLFIPAETTLLCATCAIATSTCFYVIKSPLILMTLVTKHSFVINNFSSQSVGNCLHAYNVKLETISIAGKVSQSHNRLLIVHYFHTRNPSSYKQTLNLKYKIKFNFLHSRTATRHMK